MINCFWCLVLLAWFYLTSEAMGCWEFTKHVWYLKCQKISIRGAVQRISKRLDVRKNTVKAIINKWSKWGTTMTVPNKRISLKKGQKHKTKSYHRGCQGTYGKIKRAAGIPDKYWLRSACESDLPHFSSLALQGRVDRQKPFKSLIFKKGQLL